MFELRCSISELGCSDVDISSAAQAAAEFARSLIHPNGTLVEGVMLFCDECHAWLQKTIEDAHKPKPILRAGKP